MSTPSHWFGPKRFGFGVSPSSWRGWLTLGVYCVLVVITMKLRALDAFRWPAMIVLTVAMIGIAAWKYGPRPD